MVHEEEDVGLALRPGHRQRGYATAAQLPAIGLSTEEIDRPVAERHLQCPHPGVHRHGSAPPDWTDKVMAACLAAGGDARTMGRSAARLRRLDGAEGHGIIEIGVSHPRGPVPEGVLAPR